MFSEVAIYVAYASLRIYGIRYDSTCSSETVIQHLLIRYRRLGKGQWYRLPSIGGVYHIPEVG